MQNNVTLTGKLQVPVVTLHTTGDTEAQVEQERAYADLVHVVGTQDMLRQLFIHRAGHCTQTGAELLTGFQVLMQRIETGKWEETDRSRIFNRQAQGFDLISIGIRDIRFPRHSLSTNPGSGYGP